MKFTKSRVCSGVINLGEKRDLVCVAGSDLQGGGFIWWKTQGLKGADCGSSLPGREDSKGAAFRVSEEQSRGRSTVGLVGLVVRVMLALLRSWNLVSFNCSGRCCRALSRTFSTFSFYLKPNQEHGLPDCSLGALPWIVSCHCFSQ